MHENRPPDRVKATGECTAASMFSELHELARRNIQVRNEQLKNEHEKEKFTVSDKVCGEFVGEFWVGHTTLEGEQQKTHIWFKLLMESEVIRVKEVSYTVKLDDMEGCCKLWSEGQSFDPGQVRKQALEPLLS